jgi:hypothetical protein
MRSKCRKISKPYANARKLWELAGKPEGKEERFWLEAERELAEERIRHELKTPDTL